MTEHVLNTIVLRLHVAEFDIVLPIATPWIFCAASFFPNWSLHSTWTNAEFTTFAMLAHSGCPDFHLTGGLSARHQAGRYFGFARKKAAMDDIIELQRQLAAVQMTDVVKFDIGLSIDIYCCDSVTWYLRQTCRQQLMHECTGPQLVRAKYSGYSSQITFSWQAGCIFYAECERINASSSNIDSSGTPNRERNFSLHNN